MGTLGDRMHSDPEPETTRFLDRWGPTMAVIISIVVLLASVFGSMYAG